ncbi:MAG: hypothetical protein SGCHY_001829 [Lobulomycetales sp.]
MMYLLVGGVLAALGIFTVLLTRHRLDAGQAGPKHVPEKAGAGKNSRRKKRGKGKKLQDRKVDTKKEQDILPEQDAETQGESAAIVAEDNATTKPEIIPKTAKKQKTLTIVSSSTSSSTRGRNSQRSRGAVDEELTKTQINNRRRKEKEREAKAAHDAQQEARLREYRKAQMNAHVATLTKNAVAEERRKKLAMNSANRRGTEGQSSATGNGVSEEWKHVWS